MAKKLIKLNKTDSGQNKYKIQVVSQAIGLSEGAVSGYFNNQNISVSDGITAEQVVELIEWRSRGRKYKDIDWDAVDSLIAELKNLGYEVVDVNEDKEEE